MDVLLEMHHGWPVVLTPTGDHTARLKLSMTTSAPTAQSFIIAMVGYIAESRALPNVRSNAIIE